MLEVIIIKVKNNPITSKATNLPGVIIRTHLDNIYVQFLYIDRKDSTIKIKLTDYEKYIDVSKQMKKFLNKELQKLELSTENNLNNFTS